MSKQLDRPPRPGGYDDVESYENIGRPGPRGDLALERRAIEDVVAKINDTVDY